MVEQQHQDTENDWTECWQCGGMKFSHHDCGEDTCCCLQPEDNVICDICHGNGGWTDDMESEYSS